MPLADTFVNKFLKKGLPAKEKLGYFIKKLVRSRRKFIQNIALGSTLMTLPTVAFSEVNNKPLIHQVFFWLNEGVSVTEFMKEARKLSSCATVKQLYLGTPAATQSRDVVDSSYSIACTFFFDNVEDEQRYQVDPIHLAFIDENSNKWNKVVVYDFVI
jgi:hypothetical protein